MADYCTRCCTPLQQDHRLAVNGVSFGSLCCSCMVKLAKWLERKPRRDG